MRYKPKSIAALHIALGSLPDRMHVEADPDIGVSAKTVGELRKLTAWPENLAITTPLDRHPESFVMVGKVSVATRVSPKQSCRARPCSPLRTRFAPAARRRGDRIGHPMSEVGGKPAVAV